jgi:hypothetical protein
MQLYDWDTLFNGDVHVLHPDRRVTLTTFTASRESFRSSAQQAAARRGLRLETRKAGDGLTLQVTGHSAVFHLNAAVRELKEAYRILGDKEGAGLLFLATQVRELSAGIGGEQR